VNARSCSGRPISKKIATYQQDQRSVGEMYLVNTSVGHAKTGSVEDPLPGDEVGYHDTAGDYRRGEQ